MCQSLCLSDDTLPCVAVVLLAVSPNRLWSVRCGMPAAAPATASSRSSGNSFDHLPHGPQPLRTPTPHNTTVINIVTAMFLFSFNWSFIRRDGTKINRYSNKHGKFERRLKNNLTTASASGRLNCSHMVTRDSFVCYHIRLSVSYVVPHIVAYTRHSST